MASEQVEFILRIQDDASAALRQAEESALRFSEVMNTFAPGSTTGSNGDVFTANGATGAGGGLLQQALSMSEGMQVMSDTVATTVPQVQEGFQFMAQAADVAGLSFARVGSGIGKAMAQSIGAVVAGRQQVGAAMAKMAVDSIKALASQARVKAVMELAHGFAALATPGLQGKAALHFKSAATFGLVSGVGAAAAAAIGSSDRSSSQSNNAIQRTSSSASPMAAPVQATQTPMQISVHVEGNVIGDTEFADQLAESIRRRLGDGRNFGI